MGIFRHIYKNAKEIMEESTTDSPLNGSYFARLNRYEALTLDEQ